MGRSTDGKVTITDIYLSQVKDILNSDSSSLGDTDIKFNEVFRDSEISGKENNIYNDFIDGDYCTTPTSEDTKKDELTSKSFKLYDYRNYGGIEDGLPKISWEQIITTDGIDAVPNISGITEIIENNAILEIPIYPDTVIAGSYTSPGIQRDKNLISLEQSILHRKTDENVLNKSELATKVHIDYPSGQSGVPEFQVKVTPFLSVEDLEATIGKTSRISADVANVLLGDGISGIVGDSLFTIGQALSGRYFSAYAFDAATEVIVLYEYIPISTYNDLIISDGVNYFNGLSVIDKGVIVGGVTAEGGAKTFSGITSTNGLTTGSSYQIGQVPAEARTALIEGDLGTVEFFDNLGEVLTIIGIIIKIALFFNTIYDITHPEAVIANGTYQYRNQIAGMYVFNDILNSYHTVGFGNQHIGTDNPESNLIKYGGILSELYTLDNRNYGDPFSETNLISSFPQKHPNREKYMNMKFFPRCIQYDYNTPPPVINYLVELVPVANCELSTTKLTEFVVSIAPDKYYIPEFSIYSDIIDPGLTGLPALYKDTSITFKNAKFVDFMFLQDFEKTGWFGQYFNISLNRDGINGWNNALNFPRSTTFYPGYYGDDIVMTPQQLGNKIGDQEQNDQEFLARSGQYRAAFMNEKFTNIVVNPTFRSEGVNDSGSIFYGMQKFWYYSNELEIRSGAIYKDSVTFEHAVLYQYIPVKSDTIYTLKFDVVVDSGEVIFSGNNTWYPFIHTKYFPADNNGTVGPAIALDAEVALSNYGVEYVAAGLKFNSTGSYYITIHSLQQALAAPKVEFLLSSDFIGHIGECNIQQLPYVRVGKPDKGGIGIFGLPVIMWDQTGRNAYNSVGLGQQPTDIRFIYYDDFSPEKPIYLVFNQGLDDNNTEFSFVLQPGSFADVVLYSSYGKTGNIVFEESYLNTEEADITVNISNSKYVFWASITVGTTLEESTYLTSFTCNDSKLNYFRDKYGALSGGIIDLSNSGLLNTKAYMYDSGMDIGGGGVLTFKNSFSQLVANLDLSGTNCVGDLNDLPAVTTFLDITDTQIDDVNKQLISFLNLKPDGLVVVNTNVDTLGFGQQDYTLSDVPNITWKNSGIAVGELNRLITQLYESNTEDGYLDIAGDNPEITDVDVFGYITTMVDSRGWTILYNVTSIPVITLVGDNPLILEIGHPYTEPGATAYDLIDGDITDDIIITGEVNVNLGGTYYITYNVTNSMGNPAEEIVRTVVVDPFVLGSAITSINGTSLFDLTACEVKALFPINTYSRTGYYVISIPTEGDTGIFYDLNKERVYINMVGLGVQGYYTPIIDGVANAADGGYFADLVCD